MSLRLDGSTFGTNSSKHLPATTGVAGTMKGSRIMESEIGIFLIEEKFLGSKMFGNEISKQNVFRMSQCFNFALGRTPH